MFRKKTSAVDEAAVLLAQARGYIRKHSPYLYSTTLSLVPYWVPGFSTLGVSDQLVCIIDPEWWVSLTSTKIRASCLVHEVSHVLRGMERLAALPDPRLANVAGDIPINDDLKKNPELWELPEFAIYSTTFGFPEGLTLEQYYELLSKKVQKEGMCADGTDPGGGSGEGSDIGKDGAPYKIGNVPIANKVCAGGCGSAGGNSPNAAAERRANQEAGRDKADVQQVVKDGRKAVAAYHKENQGRGSVPDSLQEVLDWEDKEAIVPWRSLLANSLRKTAGRIITGQADFSMRRPSRRSLVRATPRPGLVDHQITVVIIEDTSGSMGHEQLLAGRVEACSVLTQLNISQAYYLAADADVSDMRTIRLRDIPTLPVTGRGGTNFAPALAACERLRNPKPDIVIYFTDGDGYAPEQPPKGFEVIWCIVPSPWQTMPARWGTTVIMSDDVEVRRAYEDGSDDDENEEHEDDD